MTASTFLRKSVHTLCYYWPRVEEMERIGGGLKSRESLSRSEVLNVCLLTCVVCRGGWTDWKCRMAVLGNWAPVLRQLPKPRFVIRNEFLAHSKLSKYEMRVSNYTTIYRYWSSYSSMNGGRVKTVMKIVTRIMMEDTPNEVMPIKVDWNQDRLYCSFFQEFQGFGFTDVH